MTARLELEAELAEIEEALSEETPMEDAVRGDRADLERRAGEIRDLIAAIDAALDPPEEVTAEPMDYAPSGAALVVTGDDEQEVFAVLDRHDERAIMEELARRGTKRLFYDFDGHVDLSIHGVLEAIGLMNRTGKVRIAVDPQSAVIDRMTEDDKMYVVARVYAKDAVTGFGVFGTARQPIYMKLRSGKDKYDPFAETKALNKAQRNALGMCIPQPIRQAMIAQVTGDKALALEVQHGVGAASQAELPPPLDDERAKALNAEIRATYDEIRGLSVTALLPGLFGVKVARAQHSHELLEALRDELVAMRDHLRREDAP